MNRRLTRPCSRHREMVLVETLNWRASSSTVNTCSIAFADPRFNESEFAQQVATRYGSNHSHGAILVSTGPRVEDASRAEGVATVARY